MSDLPNLIADARKARDAYEQFDRSAEESVREQYTHARRAVFLEMLRLLITDPTVKLSDLAEMMNMPVTDLPMYIGQDVQDWLRHRHWQEAEASGG